MKQLLFFFLAIVSIIVNGQTRIYYSFPDSNAVWNMNFYRHCIVPWGIIEQNYSVTFGGDTVINSQTYHKLTIPYAQTNLVGECNGIGIGYQGSIRQDVALKKVFYVKPNETSEQLLYDFTMQVGDTVRGYIETFTYTPDIVQSIDSVLVGSNYRKRWSINPCYNIYFIEGIGSTYGLFELSPGCVTDFPDYTLTCFQQNGLTLYPDTTSSCQLITSVNSINTVSDQVKVFPNPSNGSFTIDLDKSIKFKEIQLTSLPGNIILQKLVKNQTTITIDHLPNGLYILTAIDQNDRSTYRKIISCP